VRSPTLLILNNLGGYLMTSIYICYEMIEDISTFNDDRREDYVDPEDFKLFCKIFPNNYLVCHFLMMFSLMLRTHRIIECCKINYDERIEIKEFYKKRYLFKEKHYLKILFCFMVVVIFINFLLNLQFSDTDLNLIPYHFKDCMKDPKVGSYYVSLMWVIINFFEGIVLVTYTYYIFINHIKQMIKLELLIIMFIWIIYPNVLRVSDFIFDADNDTNSHWTSYVCCLFLWLCLLLNGYLPVISAYLDNSEISYHFNPKLTANLYLFLSDEVCFTSFYDWACEKENELYHLNLYIQVLTFKLKYTLEPDYSKVILKASEIYEEYFASTHNSRINFEILNRIKTNCQMLNGDECSYDMFDEALVTSFEFLQISFKNYKKSEEYRILVDNLNLNSYIHCKMSNTGLISKN
jgi:hypothetical protein